ncbi:cytochrome P450 [Nocardiopsis sp. JB363]|uniref:cytochrome P450 family protein n=1 Tax=Nocardiopsis sp. JB363 TaxID=1434837 RepID=UPI00097A63F7|nr:cytochrome P450 [Nocardiopsis sp. JB363]SIO91159.1 putative cytochrome P450 hydroxylase [Nocardiopsis sp. JB363]
MSTPTFPDLTSPEATADPLGFLERLREAGGSAIASFGGAPARLFVDDTDARTILGDKRFVVNTANLEGETTTLSRPELLRNLGIEPDLIVYATEGVLDKDGIDHVRLRKLVSRTFTVRRVQAMRPGIQAIADRLLAELPDHVEDGSVDLLRHFAYPLPIAVICDLVGVPEDERPRWQAWSHALTSFDLGAPERLSATLRELVEASRRLIADHREHEHDDLLTDLVRVTDDNGERMSEDELITMILSLIIAGHETTANLIGNGTHALLTHPDQLALLKDDPELLPAAVHELLRWCGPVFQTRMRYASEDVELNTGTVRRGEAAIAMIAGANRDPNVHPEPDRLDLTRHQGAPGEAHLAFGHGMHYCLGAALARVEGQVAFGSLPSAFPGLSLDPNRPASRQPNIAFNRFEDLYVRL